MKKLLELLGTILITTSAAGPLVANKPNNKIKDSLETFNRKKRQTSPANKQQTTTSQDNEIEFIEKEITLNEDYCNNIQKMLQELIDENYIDPLRSINMGGLISKELDNKPIISKLEELEPKMVNWFKNQKNNKDKILILTIKNSNSKSIKLVINLNNFYLLGFINNQNQYFYFDDELLEKIKEHNQKDITKFNNLKDKLNNLKENKLLLNEEKVKEYLQQKNELIPLKEKEKNIKKLNYNNELNYLNKKIGNLQGENLKDEEEKIKFLNKLLIEKYSCQKINLNYTGAYTSDGLNVVIKENGKPDKGKDIIISKDTLNNAIVNLANYNNKQNENIKNNLVRLIFITSEAMRFQCDEKTLEIFANIKNIDELKTITSESKNILKDIQERIFYRNQTINWKDYTSQLRGDWKKYSEQFNKFRIKIWEQLINIKSVFSFFNENEKTINTLINELKDKEINKLNNELIKAKKEENKQQINKTSKKIVVLLAPKNNENNYKKYLENKQKNEIIKNNIGELKNILDLKFNDLNEWKNIEFKENIYNILIFILYEKIYLEKILIENIEKKKNSEGYEDYRFLANKIKDKFNKTNFYVPIIQLVIFQNNLDITNLLINLDSNIINDYNYEGLTSLHQSIINNCLEILKKLLINSTTNINIKNNVSGNTALHYASMEGNLEAVKLLIQHGADVNIQDNIFGNTALHYASMEGNLEAVKLLIQHGADVNIQDNIFNEAPLHIAVTNNYYEIVEILVANGANINKESLSGKTALHYASFLGKINCLEKLLTNSNIKDNVNINLTDKDGFTALHYASMEGNLEAVKLLIQHGADVNIQDNIFGNTALHYSIQNGYLEVFKLLIQHGADVNIQDNNRQTALHWIAIITSDSNEKEIIEKLKNIDFPGLQITKFNNSFKSFKTIYYVKPNIDIKMIQFLIEQKIIANINIKNNNNEIAINLCKNKKKRKLLKQLQTTLSNLITKTYLDKIADNSDKTILNVFTEKNEEFKKFFSRGQLYVTNITNNSAIINSPAPNIYTGEVKVTFTIKKETSSIQPQLGSSNSDNQDGGSRYCGTGKNSDTTNQSSNSGNAGFNSSSVSAGDRPINTDTQGQNFNQKQQTNQYDVPSDGSCLFWSVVMAYLLPIKNNNSKFEKRFIQLFGELQLSYLSYVQSLLQQFDVTNHSSTQAWYQSAIANRLVRVVLRNRIADYIERNLDTIANVSSGLTFRNLIQDNNEIDINYLERMRQPATWGGTPEIIAMANMLNANISVDNDSPYQPVNQNSNNNINLFYVELKEGYGVKNHYNFILTTENSGEIDTKLEQESFPNSLDSTLKTNSSKIKLPVDDHSQYHQTITKNDDNNNGNSAIKKAINKYNELSKDKKQEKLNKINQHFQSLPENEQKAFINKLKVIGTSAIGAGISAVGTKITVSSSNVSTSVSAGTEAIEMTPFLSEGGLAAAETLSVAEGTAVVATEGAVIGAEAGTAAALAPETLGLSLVIGGLAIAGTAIIWWLSGHDNTQIAKHESHNQYNNIEKYYKFLAHDQLKLDINSDTWDKIKQIYQENANNYQEFKNKVKSEITNFYKEDHSGWGGTISDEDINILIKIMFNHFEEIDNHFFNNSNHGWKIITNTIGSYFQLDSE